MAATTCCGIAPRFKATTSKAQQAATIAYHHSLPPNPKSSPWAFTVEANNLITAELVIAKTRR